MEPIFNNPDNVFEFSDSFSYSDSDELDPLEIRVNSLSPKTPPKTAGNHLQNRDVSPITPSAVNAVVKMLQNATPGRPANRAENEKLEELEQALTGSEVQKSRSVRKLLFALENDAVTRLDGPVRTLVNEDGGALFSVTNIDDQVTYSWVEQFAQILRKLDVDIQFVNMGHLTKPQIIKQLTKGFHFCPDGHAEEGCIKKSYLNPYTGVWFAKFNAGKKDKTSSFFPKDIIDEDQLLRVLSEGEKIAQSQNRALFKSQTPLPFHFEVYYKEGGLYITSAFPIFHFTRYHEGALIELPEMNGIPMEAILAELQKLDEYEIQKFHRFTFNTNTTTFHVMEVASLIQKCPIEQGVYIQFTSSEIPKFIL